LSNALGMLANASTPALHAEVEFAIDQAQIGLTLLSAAVVRLGQEDLKAEFRRALDVHKANPTRVLFQLREHVTEYLRSVATASDEAIIAEFDLEIASLPIPGASGFGVSVPEHWPEITNFLDQWPGKRT